MFTVVRDPVDPQQFQLQYMCGDIRTYLSTDRDSLLASLLDSVRATGNRSVCIQMQPTQRGAYVYADDLRVSMTVCRPSLSAILLCA